MNKLSKAGFLLAVVSMAYLAWILLTRSSTPLNLATWATWFGIDFILILSLVRAKKPYALMVAFTLGTAVILIIALMNYFRATALFVWGIAETMSVIAVVVALVVWRMVNTADAGVIATSLAMVVAGIPTWINAFQSPESQNVLFWSMSACACALSYFGTQRGFVDRFMPATGVLSNTVIIVLASRQFA